VLLDPLYQSAAGPIAAIDILYGHRASMSRGNLYMAHHCGFTLKALMGTMRESGFKSVAGLSRKKDFDLWVVASKTELSEEDLKELLKSHLPV
jgi:hypothetical protein